MSLPIKTCAIFGHSEIEITNELEQKIIFTFKELISIGVDTFYFGGLGMFDGLCYKILTELKERYPHIKRVFCLFDQRHLRYNKRPKWLKEQSYDDFIYFDLDFNWWYKRIYYRNCAVIDRSDIVLFYAENRQNSGAYKALRYAKKKNKNIINLV